MFSTKFIQIIKRPFQYVCFKKKVYHRFKLGNRFWTKFLARLLQNVFQFYTKFNCTLFHKFTKLCSSKFMKNFKHKNSTCSSVSAQLSLLQLFCKRFKTVQKRFFQNFKILFFDNVFHLKSHQ